MRTQKFLTGAMAGIFAAFINSQLVGAETQDVAEHTATIYYSAAPWDGPAYAINIPLEKTNDVPGPAININIWGNPEFIKPETIHFSGKEDSGGGAGKGSGRAYFQSIPNKSWPENLAGTVIFKNLQPGRPVSATYDLATSNGKRFTGGFEATWGNQPIRVIR
jgi:hypothetical protein